MGSEQPPLVISASYGADEAAVAHVADLFNIEFIKVTFIPFKIKSKMLSLGGARGCHRYRS